LISKSAPRPERFLTAYLFAAILVATLFELFVAFREFFLHHPDKLLDVLGNLVFINHKFLSDININSRLIA
jgi:hypothetical protein